MANKAPNPASSDSEAKTRPDSITSTTLTLGLFALLAALLLGSINLLTADRVQQQQLAAERRALNEILPASLHDNDLISDAIMLNSPSSTLALENLSDLQLSIQRQAYIARQNGTMTGLILPVETRAGYSGTIVMLVGILSDGTISGVRVLEHRETPGLGDKIDIGLSDWIRYFDGKSVGNPLPTGWQVVKDNGEFDQLAGATITSRAIVDSVKRALRFFETNQGKFEIL